MNALIMDLNRKKNKKAVIGRLRGEMKLHHKTYLAEVYCKATDALLNRGDACKQGWMDGWKGERV